MRLLALLVVLTGLVALSGCMTVYAPTVGMIYTDVKDPIFATSEPMSLKSGTATAKSILGLVATGDASITAAARQGEIKKITHVDHHSTNMLGIVGTFTTIVYGN